MFESLGTKEAGEKPSNSKTRVAIALALLVMVGFGVWMLLNAMHPEWYWVKLYNAARNGDLSILRTEFAKNPKLSSEQNQPPPDVVRELGSGTMLHRASSAGQDEVVDYLLDHGANIEARDDMGFTPLLSALSSMAPGAPSQSTGTRYHSPTATISHLLDKGANGDRALCLAVGKDLAAAVGVLVANRTSFPNCDAADVLPLQMVGLTKERSCRACVTLLFAAAGSDYEMVRLLLAAGDRQVTGRELDAMVKLGATRSADLIRQTISHDTTSSRPIK